MKLQARLEWSEENGRIARAVVDALEPCNRGAPEGVRVYSIRRGKRVRTEVSVEGELKTLMATLEDLFSCAFMAERVLKG